MSREVQIDVLIFGGGIAGLWTLARLRREGYSCLLVESASLGAGQTIASQGIIHGGVKYALTGQATSASRAIAEMPGIWRTCLEGRGELDLRGVRVLSEKQLLWTTTGIGSRLAGVAASKAIRTSVDSLGPGERPEWLAAAPRGVDAYAVDEPVLDPRSLVETLGAACRDSLGIGTWSGTGPVRVMDAAGEEHAVTARRVVLAAGAGNAGLMRAMGHEPARAEGMGVGTQVRPLHMVMARSGGRRLPLIYGHCVGFSDKPRITITSQVDAAGEGGRTVWYIGGNIAETGVERGSAEQIAAAREEVSACLPWLDLADVQWSTLRIDRAEGTPGRGGGRPDEPVVREVGDGIVAFPTKLAFAPLLASRVTELVRRAVPRPSGSSDPGIRWRAPGVGTLPWEREGITWS